MQQSLPENLPGISPSLHHFLERGLVWRLLAGHLRRAGSLRRPAAPDAGHPPCDLSAESGRPVCIGAPSSGRSCGARPSCTSEPSGSLESRGANWVRAPRRPSAPKLRHTSHFNMNSLHIYISCLLHFLVFMLALSWH